MLEMAYFGELTNEAPQAFFILCLAYLIGRSGILSRTPQILAGHFRSAFMQAFTSHYALILLEADGLDCQICLYTRRRLVADEQGYIAHSYAIEARWTVSLLPKQIAWRGCTIKTPEPTLSYRKGRKRWSGRASEESLRHASYPCGDGAGTLVDFFSSNLSSGKLGGFNQAYIVYGASQQENGEPGKGAGRYVRRGARKDADKDAVKNTEEGPGTNIESDISFDGKKLILGLGLVSNTPDIVCIFLKHGTAHEDCSKPKRHWKELRSYIRSGHLKRHRDRGELSHKAFMDIERFAMGAKDPVEEKAAWQRAFVRRWPEFESLQDKLNPYLGEELLPPGTIRPQSSGTSGPNQEHIDNVPPQTPTSGASPDGPGSSLNSSIKVQQQESAHVSSAKNASALSPRVAVDICPPPLPQLLAIRDPGMRPEHLLQSASDPSLTQLPLPGALSVAMTTAGCSPSSPKPGTCNRLHADSALMFEGHLPDASVTSMCQDSNPDRQASTNEKTSSEYPELSTLSPAFNCQRPAPERLILQPSDYTSSVPSLDHDLETRTAGSSRDPHVLDTPRHLYRQRTQTEDFMETDRFDPAITNGQKTVDQFDQDLQKVQEAQDAMVLFPGFNVVEDDDMYGAAPVGEIDTATNAIDPRLRNDENGQAPIPPLASSVTAPTTAEHAKHTSKISKRKKKTDKAPLGKRQQRQS